MSRRHVGMSSTVGVGSIFWFELGVVPVTREEANGLAAKVEAEETLPRCRILLVEDNKVNQIVATRFLIRLGQDVEIANDGAEAVSISREQTFDLILMDCQMPEMDGFEATRRIREQEEKSEGGPRRMPIIALTANATQGDEQRCLDAGMDAYCSKPINPKTLFRTILQWLNADAQSDSRTINDPSGT